MSKQQPYFTWKQDKKAFIVWAIITLLFLFMGIAFGQTDSVKVRLKVKKTYPYCLLESKKANYYIECPCDSLRRGQIVYVRERDLLNTKN